MTFVKDFVVWFKAMGTLPWPIQVWACLYPLPQIVGGLIFIQTLPGVVILVGRIVSGIVASRVHKHAPFSKLMGPVGHAHWVLIVPYLLYELATQDLSTPLFWFVSYVVVTTLISLAIDIHEFLAYLRNGHVQFNK